MCPCEFSVPTNAHVRIDYACEVLLCNINIKLY